MSELGKVPSFEPDEETRALIESMFIQKQEAKQEAKQVEEIKPVAKRHRVRIPEPPAQTKEQQEVATHLAKEEMDIIHDAFMEFSEKTSETVLYGHLYTEILKLVEAFTDMEAIINDDIKKDELTENGLDYYEKMRTIRARVLNDIYNKYEKEE
jgi:hypothetical protein